MIRRFRILTALLALTTLFAYAAEGAVALALCAPTTAEHVALTGDAHVGDAPSHAGGSGHATHAPAHGTDTPADGHGDPSSDTHQGHCPLSMSAGSCAAASLPEPAPQVQPAPITRDTGWLLATASREDADSSPQFHPPRA